MNIEVLNRESQDIIPIEFINKIEICEINIKKKDSPMVFFYNKTLSFVLLNYELNKKFDIAIDYCDSLENIEFLLKIIKEGIFLYLVQYNYIDDNICELEKYGN